MPTNFHMGLITYGFHNAFMFDIKMNYLVIGTIRKIFTQYFPSRVIVAFLKGKRDNSVYTDGLSMLNCNPCSQTVFCYANVISFFKKSHFLS